MNDTGSRPRYRWRAWKIAGVAIAALLLVGGGLLALAERGDEPEPAPSGTEPAGVGPRSFGPTTGPGSTPLEAPEAESDGGISWSPVLVRGGISFFAAFALAFAFRSFLRLALIFVGLWVGSMLLFSSMGWMDVHWDRIDDSFVGWAGTLSDQFRSITAFITGSLPSAGLAGLGLLAGFRRG